MRSHHQRAIDDLCLQDTSELSWPLIITEAFPSVGFPVLFRILPMLVCNSQIYTENGNSRHWFLPAGTAWYELGFQNFLKFRVVVQQTLRGFRKIHLMKVERPGIVPESSEILKNIVSYGCTNVIVNEKIFRVHALYQIVWVTFNLF